MFLFVYLCCMKDMEKIVSYLAEIGYGCKNPFGHKVPDIIDMIRNCKSSDEQKLLHDNEFVALKSMITSYDRDLKLQNIIK